MKFALYLGLFFLTIGCGGTTYLVPVENQIGVKLVEIEEQTLITSKEKNSTIAVQGVDDLRNLKLFVYIQNQAKDTLNFVQKDVKVFGLKENEMVQLYTYSPEEYIKVLKKKQMLSGSLTAMEQTIDYANPENITIKTNEDVTERDGFIDVNDNNTDREDDEVNWIARQTIESDAIINKQLQKEKITSVGRKLLSDYSIISGETIFGDVMIKSKGFKKYLLIVPVGNEEHLIYFTLQKNETEKN